MTQSLFFVLAGVLFGLANVIPGVSGGTMAVVFGVYERLIGILSDPLRGIKKEWKFLVTFGIGLVIGILAFGKLMNLLLESDYRSETFLFFIGVILGSLPMLFKKAFIPGGKGSSLRLTAGTAVAFLLGFAIMIPMIASNTGSDKEKAKSGPIALQYAPAGGEAVAYTVPGDQLLSSALTEGQIVAAEGPEDAGALSFDAQGGFLWKNADRQETGTYVYKSGKLTMTRADGTVFSAKAKPVLEKATVLSALLMLVYGVIASATMIIPGISGSFVMLLIGVYPTIMAAVAALTSSQILSAALLLVPFGIGIVLGLVFCSRLIKYLLKNHETITYAAIFGFVLGSIGCVAREVKGITVIGVIALIGGIAVLWAFDHFSPETAKE